MKINKPSFWDTKKPNLISKVLSFISYFIILKNILNRKKSIVKSVKTICVGNIYLGGTGKTPTSIYINRILRKQRYRTTFIKKFYKDQLDEQKILKKSGNLICEKNRLNAIKIAGSKKFDFAICDDGLQDSEADYSLKIVCFNFDSFIGNGKIIPAGPLRESIKNIKNYDIAIINSNGENINPKKKYLKKINKNLKIYQGIYNVSKKNIKTKNIKYIAFSGIGNHQTFLKTLKNNHIKIFKNYNFPDHYNYNDKDIFKIKQEAKKNNCKIITTEKDIMRLNKNNKKNINYLKIEIKIIEEKNLIRSLKNL